MNPFKYGKEVAGYQFYDRSESCGQLYHTLKDGSTNVVLYAPRRYGKTSLVLKVAAAETSSRETSFLPPSTLWMR